MAIRVAPPGQGEDKVNLKRIGLTWYVRFTVPMARRLDCGCSEVVRTLQTRDIKEARSRRLQALEAIRRELDAALAAKGLPPLAGAWAPPWEERGLALRREIAEASDEPYPDAEGMSPKADLVSEAVEEARELEEREGPEAARAFWNAAIGEGVTIRFAVDRCLRDKAGQLKGSSLANYGQATELLGSFLRWRFTDARRSKDPLTTFTMDRITRSLAGEAVEWLQNAEESGEARAPATVQRIVSSLSGVWTWAGVKGLATVNPWSRQGAGLKQKNATHREGKEERPYTPAEVVKLLRADPNEGRRWNYGPALWDLLRLGLLTGARLGELCGLERRDVAEGCESFRIRDGKTASARREVPLHAFVVPIIRARVAALPTNNPQPSDPLFPELPPGGKDRKRSHKASSRFTTFRRSVLGEDDTVDFHSLRRTFLAATGRAYAAGSSACNPIVEASLVGHQAPTLASSVYAGPTDMVTRRKAVAEAVALGMPEEVRKALEETQDKRPGMMRKERSRPYADPRNVRRATVAKRGRKAATKAG